MDPQDTGRTRADRPEDAGARHALAAFVGLPDAVFVHRAGTHEVAAANPAALHAYAGDWRPDSGVDLWSILGTDDHAGHFARAGGGPLVLSARARGADGSEREIELRSARAGGADAPVWITLVLDDRERGGTEQRPKESEDRAATSTAKHATFVAAIGHELRTPLNGILGMSNLLLESALPADQREYVDTIHGATETMLVLIGELLDLTKIEAGRLEIGSGPFSPAQLCSDALRPLRARAEEQGLRLEFEQLTSIPRRCRGDVRRLHQILGHLLGNAIRTTPTGYVMLRVRQLGVEANGARLRFEIEDTGIGFGSDRLPDLFEPFSQAKGSSGSAYGGTGLGLAMCQRLLQLMGSRLEVRSVPERGTTFWFDIVLDDLDGETERDTMEKANGDVLYVGAHGPSREAYVRALAQRGYAVEGCDLSATALDRVRRRTSSGEPYRAVFVERQLPDLDGETLGRSVRNRLRIPTLPLYLVTTPERPVAIDRARRSGFVAVIDDPDEIVALEPFTTDVTDATVAATAARESQAAAPAARTVAEVPIVLVVEDNPVNQKVVCHMLRKMGFAVELAEDGQQGVDRLRSGHFDLVLMDCQMPVMDGYEATRTIRSLGDPRSRIPVVALTANAMEGDREKCLAAGMDDYLSKPAKAEHLRTMLQKWIPACEQRLRVLV